LIYHSNYRIVSASHDQTIKVWDAKTYALIKTLEGHTDIVRHAVFSPNNQYIVSCSFDNTLKVWDVTMDYNVVTTLYGHTDKIYKTGFSLDGK
jgi:WD40 repeat protein